jgi:hypothetical protein
MAQKVSLWQKKKKKAYGLIDENVATQPFSVFLAEVCAIKAWGVENLDRP